MKSPNSLKEICITAIVNNPNLFNKVNSEIMPQELCDLIQTRSSIIGTIKKDSHYQKQDTINEYYIIQDKKDENTFYVKCNRLVLDEVCFLNKPFQVVEIIATIQYDKNSQTFKVYMKAGELKQLRDYVDPATADVLSIPRNDVVYFSHCCGL